MANTYTLIASSTIGSGGAANIEFTSIPATYTDLLLVISARTDRAAIADGYLIKPNNTTPTIKNITGDGTAVSSSTNYSGIFPAATATASTFGNSAAYFSNYANTSYNKSFSVDDVSENNATNAYATLSANLYASTSAITSIRIESINAANFVQYSTAYLYGIKNS
jgi:hypothetical protein